MRIITIVLISLMSSQLMADTWTISQQLWSRPRSGEFITQLPQLREMMQLRRNREVITITYPGGDEGSLWINELQSWLVALGIASADMELIPGSSRQAVIELEVVSGAGNVVTSANKNEKLDLTGVKP